MQSLMETVHHRASRPRRALRYGIPVLLLLIVLATYFGVLGHNFVAWDDNVNILENPHVNGITPETVAWMLTDTSYAGRYMPIGWLCYALDRELFGLNAKIWHGGNLLVHAANALLLFFLLRRVVLKAVRERTTVEGKAILIATWCGALGALFWAVNPLRVEVVAWASARIYNVAFLFAMLWLLAWVQACGSRPGSTQQRALSWISLFAFAASLLTYPIAVFGPALLFLLDIYPLGRLSPEIRTWGMRTLQPLLREKIPFLLVSATVLVITAFARLGAGGEMQPATLEQFGVIERGMQAAHVLAYYVWRPLTPLGLSASYPTLHAFNPLAWNFLAGALAVAASVFGVLWYTRRSVLPLALWLCHAVLLVPFLGLSEYPHVTYDRYSHFHAVLSSGIVAVVLCELWIRRGHFPRLFGCGAIAACAFFAALAIEQVPVWKETTTLHGNIAARFGDHPSRGRFDEVLAHAYLRAGLTNQAIASWKQAAQFDSLRTDRHIYNERVVVRSKASLARLARDAGDLNSAASHYKEAAEAESVAFYVVPLAIQAAELLIKVNRGPEALPLLRKAIETAPGNATLHQQLGVILRQLGDEVQARHHFEEEQRLQAALQAKSKS